MKSLTAVCQTGASMPAINPNGRISRHPPNRGDGENAEMKMYLSKLKDLVPFMPKNRKLSKLEIIQHVIDYICDLQSELETHPEISNFDAAAALNFTANLERVSSAHNGHDDDGDDDDDDEMYDDGVQERLNGSMQQQSSPAQRQPLVDRQTPNTILPATHQQQQQLIVSAVNNTTSSNTTTTINSSTAAANTTTTTASSASAAASNLSHTVGFHCKKNMVL